MSFKESIAKVKPLQGESDFLTWKRRICGQLEAFNLWRFVQGVVPEPTLGEGEGQDDFTDRREAHIIKRCQAMHLLENTISDHVFATLRSHGYNLDNRNSKILIDTLTIVLTKSTIGFVQFIGRELFTIDAMTFDFLRAYVNRAAAHRGCKAYITKLGRI